MTGLFSTLGTSTRGMIANQTALQTSGHNIANTNTVGYSRQRVVMNAELPYKLAGVGNLGMGVRISSVDRIVDNFIRVQTREANSKYNFYAEKADVLGQLEKYMNEPSDTGLINQLGVLNDSWSKLASNPESTTAKTLVVENSQTFADMVNQTMTDMDSLKNETLQNIEKSVLDFNEKVKQLQVLNDQIFAVGANGETPNDLLDTRDQLLRELSGLGEISADFDMYGRVESLKVGTPGSEVLGNDNQVTELVADVTTGEVKLDGGGIIDFKGGSIGGLQAAAEEIDSRKIEFQGFVSTVVDGVNGLYDKNGFNIDTVSGKVSIESTIKDNPSTLVTGNPDAGGNIQPGDGSLALEISKAFSEKNVGTDPADPDNMTFAERYNSIVTKNGISKQQADNVVSAQHTVLNQLDVKDQSMSGVNINEEVSDVIRFQQSFQANARVIQTISEMLDTLINRTGV